MRACGWRLHVSFVGLGLCLFLQIFVGGRDSGGFVCGLCDTHCSKKKLPTGMCISVVCVFFYN